MSGKPKQVPTETQAQQKNVTGPKTMLVRGDFYAYFTPLARLNAYSSPVGCCVAFL